MLALAGAAVATGCARRPVLYPNATLEEGGRAAAEREIDRCVALAREARAGGAQARDVARDTAEETVVGGAAGGAAGAVAGAIGGGGAGHGAAVGAASGAAWSGVSALVRGLFGGREPDPIEQRYVERCLRERGYEPIGWR